MFKKASVADLKSGLIPRENNHVVIAMCHYPRGVSKELSDEYISVLAPSPELLSDFLSEKKRIGSHNAAFLKVQYERRFALSDEAIGHLRRLAEISRERDVTIVCQCGLDVRCHREMLLIVAKRWYGAAAELRRFSYPEFERRIPDEEGKLLDLA